MTNTIEIRPLNPAIGAVVEGVELAEPLSAETVSRLSDALWQHQVLFFENQPITPAQQKRLASHFGQLHVHPVYPNVPEHPEIIVLDTDAANLPDNDNWHTDVTFIRTPPLGAVLSAKLIPPNGGDTLWTNGIAAYEALSEPIRTLLDSLSAEHDFEKSFPRERYLAMGKLAEWEKARRDHPPLIHPVVRTHPVTQRKGLFVNEGFTTRIVGLKPRESDTLLRFLIDHVARPEFFVRWKWKQNDLAIWDNRLTQHYAVADYLPHRRVMHRATIIGDTPF
ncbi:MAG TPA: taurine dioxygenase [Noviherbaspirillum sp.]